MPRGAWAGIALVLVGGVGALAWSWNDWPYRELAGTENGLPLAFHPDGQRIAVSTEGGIDLFDVATGERRARWPRFDSHLARLGWFSPDGRTLVTRTITTATDPTRMLKVIDTATGTLRGSVNLPGSSVRSHASLDGGRTFRAVCTGREGGFVIDVELEPFRVRSQRRLAFTPQMTPHAITADGAYLAMASDREGPMRYGGWREVTIWDLEADRELAILPMTDSRMGISALAFSPDGQTLAVGRQDGSVELWDVPGRRLRSTVWPHSPNYNAFQLEFSRDGSKLVSWGNFVRYSLSLDSASAHVSKLLGRPNSEWAFEVVAVDLASGRRLRKTNGEVMSVPSPDGRSIATVPEANHSLVRLRSMP
jgi:WD40 repeat protein